MRSVLAAFGRDHRLLLLAFLLWGFSYGMWLHLQPLYIEFLGAKPQQVGAALGLAGLAVVFVYVPAGLLADRRRRKPLMAGGWALGSVALLFVAIAPDWRWVIPGFAIYQLSTFSRPVVAGHIAAIDRSDNVSTTFALLSSGFSVGAILAPAFGGWIGEQFGLRTVFFGASAVALVSTLAIWQVSDGPTPAPARAGEIHPRRLLADRLFLWQIFVLFLIVFALELGTVLAPNYLQDEKGLSIQQIGQLGAVASLGMFVFMLGLGQMRSDRRTSLLLNQLIVIGALLLLLTAPGATGALALQPILLLGYFLRGGDRAVWPITRGRLSRWLAPEVLSLGFSFLDTAAQLARTLAPYVAGLLYAIRPTFPLYGGILALALTSLLTLTLPHRGPEPLSEAPLYPT